MSVFRPSEYLTPKSIEEAVSILGKYGDKAKIVAGGTQVHETAERGMIPQVEALVDIEKLSLKYIREDGEHVRIGAMTTFTDMIRSELLRKVCPIIPEALSGVRPVQIRNTSTIGGSICSGLPLFDLPPVLLALEAKLTAVSSSGERMIDIEKFFIDYFLTDLKPTELVTEVRVLRLQPSTATAFMKLERLAVDLPTLNVAVKITAKGGKCTTARIALGAVGRTPIRAKSAEKSLEGNEFREAAIDKACQEAAKEVKPIRGVHASAEYKRDMTHVYVKRALIKAMQRLGGA